MLDQFYESSVELYYSQCMLQALTFFLFQKVFGRNETDPPSCFEEPDFYSLVTY